MVLLQLASEVLRLGFEGFHPVLRWLARPVVVVDGWDMVVGRRGREVVVGQVVAARKSVAELAGSGVIGPFELNESLRMTTFLGGNR